MEVKYKMLNIPYNNFKTQKCKYWEQGQVCKFGRNCTYAHGSEEVRQPYEELPVDILDNLEITNPSAFRLLHAQVQHFTPKFVCQQDDDAMIRIKFLQANQYLQTDDKKEQGIQILQQMINSSQISFQCQGQDDLPRANPTPAPVARQL
jgi:hypothetical protein